MANAEKGNGMFRKTVIATVLAACLVSPALAENQDAQDAKNMDSIKRGLELSQLLCMKCHAISGPGPGREEKSPPFASLIDKLTVEGVADQLLEGLPLGHDPMPRWEFSEQQAEDLMLYIEYIGRKKTLQ